MSKRAPHTQVKNPTLKHWRLDIDDIGIFWLYCDRAGESTNTLGNDVMLELESVIDFASERSAISSGVRVKWLVRYWNTRPSGAR